MANHIISLNLTTEQLNYLNDAINEQINCILDSSASELFRNELSTLLNQCLSLHILSMSIDKSLSSIN